VGAAARLRPRGGLAQRCLLARCCDQGDGVGCDAGAAARLYQLGSNEGSALCRARLALLCVFGRGVERSREKAEALFPRPPFVSVGLQIAATSLPGVPVAGRYPASDSGAAFLRAAFVNLGLPPASGVGEVTDRRLFRVEFDTGFSGYT
jgi:hypothetical protein